MFLLYVFLLTTAEAYSTCPAIALADEPIDFGKLETTSWDLRYYNGKTYGDGIECLHIEYGKTIDARTPVKHHFVTSELPCRRGQTKWSTAFMTAIWESFALTCEEKASVTEQIFSDPVAASFNESSGEEIAESSGGGIVESSGQGIVESSGQGIAESSGEETIGSIESTNVIALDSTSSSLVESSVYYSKNHIRTDYKNYLIIISCDQDCKDSPEINVFAKSTPGGGAQVNINRKTRREINQILKRSFPQFNSNKSPLQQLTKVSYKKCNNCLKFFNP